MKKQLSGTLAHKFYTTTPIYYVNDRPHIGHAYTSVVADALARYHRELRENVFFLTGVDEHGRKIVEAAEKAKLDPQLFVDTNTEYFKKLLRALNISNDNFIRTTDTKKHIPKVIEVWNKLKEKGDIYKGMYKGLYCVGHEAFLKSSELANGICPDHGKKPEVIEEENYFFRLSKYAKEIELRIRSNELRIIPETRKNEMLGFLKDELEDISFSRPRKDLSWGIPVPDDNTQTVYVWADALTNYISGLGDKFDAFFPPDVQVLGKDILRFHAVIWPAMLFSLGLSIPKALLVHGHITIKGEKMSKTLGNVIDPLELVKKYGVDPVRYYLLREIRTTEDGDFSFEKLEGRYESDLNNGLSNLTHRVLTLAWNNKNVLGELPRIEVKQTSIPTKYKNAMENFDTSEALECVWRKIRDADKLVNDSKLWALPKENPQKFKGVITELLEILGLVSYLLKPFLPETSEKIETLILLKEKPESIFKRLTK